VPCARCPTAYCIFCLSPLCLTKSDQLTLVSQVNVFTGWLAQTHPHGDDDGALHSRLSTCAFDRHLNIYILSRFRNASSSSPSSRLSRHSVRPCRLSAPPTSPVHPASRTREQDSRINFHKAAFCSKVIRQVFHPA
jgi:hypothetical protein